LVGGPAGAALIAAAGVAYLVTRQSDGEKQADALAESIERLSNTYFDNADAAKRAGDAQLEAAQKTLEALRIDVSATESRFSINFFERYFNENQIEGFKEAIRDTYDEIDRIKSLIDQQVSLAATVQPYDLQSASDAADAFDLVGARAKSAQEIIDKLLPDDAKQAKLDEYGKRLQEALQLGVIDEDIFDRANASIQLQIDKLGENAEAIRRSKEQATELEKVLDEAFPEQARRNALNDQLATLQTALDGGVIGLELYNEAAANLRQTLSDVKASERADEIKEFTDAIERRVETPFASYAQDIQLLQQAAQEVPDRIDGINLALANLDNEIRLEFTTIGSADTVSEATRLYQEQLALLNEFHQARQVSAEQAAQDLSTLEANYASQVSDINRQLRDTLASLGNATPSILLEFELGDNRAELDALLASRQITQVEYQTTLEGLEAAHQEKLTELVRAGEATREQAEQASFQSRLAGVQAKYEQEIGIATGLAEAILSSEVQREQIEAQAAQQRAQSLQTAADEAQAAYEKNGTEENKILAENAAKRAAIADEAARREFEQSKSAQLDQARVSQLLTIINAYATGGNWYTGLGLALVAKLETDKVIDRIQSTQYGGGSGGSVSVSSGASYTGPTNNAVDSNAQASAQQAAPIIQPVVIVSDIDDVADQSKIEERFGRRLQDLAEAKKITIDSRGFNFDNMNQLNQS